MVQKVNPSTHGEIKGVALTGQFAEMLRIDLLGFEEEDFKPGDLFAQIHLRPVWGLLSEGG